MRTIQNLIGNYQTFFSDLLWRMKTVGIHIKNLPLSHLTFRSETDLEYLSLRDKLIPHCSEFVETQFNGRAVAIHILREALTLEDGFKVSMIELTAPRPMHRYPSGLESFGAILGDKLPAFIQTHQEVLTGIKDHGEHCKPAFLTFENAKTAKFYDISLREIVLLQGWELAEQPLTECLTE